MAFFQIQESPSVFLNTDYIERFQFSYDPEATDTGNLTIHFVSGENVTFNGAQGLASYETLLEVLGEEGVEED
ncbi:MAG: hypothetical protein EOP83_32190 [Verrucomicrobiaceae bacterium]|nr:MAG: hypothetical protein EOP83_32190 [Verrucomicrobiaceae bacterium]